MQKNTQSSVPYQGFDTRIAPRTDIYARAPLCLPDGRQITVTILNISADGLLCHCAERFEIGDDVTLKLPVLGNVRGGIIWFHNTNVGVQFNHMISVQDYLPLIKALGHIVRTS